MAHIHEIIPVFVSSKQEEFAEERTAILQKLSDMELLAPDMMESWSPGSQNARSAYLDRVRAAMLYVGLFGCRYSLPTEEEYRAARENRYKEMLIYIRRCEHREPKLKSLLDEIEDLDSGCSGRIYSTWSEIQPYFERHLWDAVGRMARAYHRLGQGQASSRSGAGASEQARLLYGIRARAVGMENRYSEIGAMLEEWQERHRPSGS
jgi:hypothetical protein